MSPYKAIARASVNIKALDDKSLYKAQIYSTNGTILQPYDLSTTLYGVVYDSSMNDITDKVDIIKWKKYNPKADNLEYDEGWSEKHSDSTNSIKITKDDVDSKSTFYFEAYKKRKHDYDEDELIAYDIISIVDINDLLASTEKPKNPYVGQVWVDDSTDPATIYMWNGYKWIICGNVENVVRNLIHNSNFSTYTYDYFDIVGDTTQSFTPSVNMVDSKRWLTLEAETLVDMERGIGQTVIDSEKVVKDSNYSFQFLYYTDNLNKTWSNNITVKIISIDENNKETLIKKEQITADQAVKQYFTDFKTLSDTKTIRVEILGENKHKYRFYVTELALYNTPNLYPWTANPEDNGLLLDDEALFNALTRNGEIKGIVRIIGADGQPRYAADLDYCTVGKLHGQYIDARQLLVQRSDGVQTLYIDEYGNVNLAVSSLKIVSKQTSETTSIEDFILSQIDSMTPEQLKYFLMQIQKDNQLIEDEYQELYNQENLVGIDYDKNWGDYLDDEYLDKAKNDDMVSISSLNFNADNTVSVLNKEDGTIESRFVLGSSQLGFSALGDSASGNVKGKLKTLLYYTHMAYRDSYTDLVKVINAAIKDKEDEVTTLANEDTPTLTDDYSDYSVKAALLNKLFMLCRDYMLNNKVKFVTDEWSNFEVDPKKVITEVGKVLSTYTADGTLIGSIGSIANEKITADAIINTVAQGAADPNNKKLYEIYSATILQQTANGIFAGYGEDLKPGDKLDKYTRAMINLDKNGVFLSAKNKDGQQSFINISGEDVKVSSDNIYLDGSVTFTDLLHAPEKGNTTTINGGYLTTGSINARDAIIAKTLTGDMVYTGILTNARDAETGEVIYDANGKINGSYFNLNDGTFSLSNGTKSVLNFDGETLSFDSDVSYSINKGSFTGELAWIREWTDNSTIINSKQVMSPRAFFGTVDMDKPTGVSIGSALGSIYGDSSEYGKLDAGIAGYLRGNQTFKFDVDGSIKIGYEKGKQLLLDTEGNLTVPHIYSKDISLYNLNVYKKATNEDEFNFTDINTRAKSFSIDAEGNISMTPTTFYLYNGDKKALSLENGTVNLNINDMNMSGKLSSKFMNVTDGYFSVGPADAPIFKITDDNNIIMSPTEFHLKNGTTDAITLLNKKVSINADFINAGQLDGKYIKAGTIEAKAFYIGTGYVGTGNVGFDNLMKNATVSLHENDGTVIENTELDKIKKDFNMDSFVTITNSIDTKLSNGDNEVRYIEIDFGNTYYIDCLKFYWGFDTQNTHYYKIKYKQDNTAESTWTYLIGNATAWYTSTVPSGPGIPTPTVHNLFAVHAVRYLRIYLNGNNKTEGDNKISTLYSLGAFYGGTITTIDASGITTGKLQATQIDTNAINVGHINISENNFTFKNNNNTVFAITGEKNKCSIIMKPTDFVLQPYTYNADGTAQFKGENAITLHDGEININANYLKAGEIDANIVKVKNLSADNITSGKFSADRINAKGLVVNKETEGVDENGNPTIVETPTLKIDSNGNLYMDINNLVLSSGATSSKLLYEFNNEVSVGISPLRHRLVNEEVYENVDDSLHTNVKFNMGTIFDMAGEITYKIKFEARATRASNVYVTHKKYEKYDFNDNIISVTTDFRPFEITVEPTKALDPRYSISCLWFAEEGDSTVTSITNTITIRNFTVELGDGYDYLANMLGTLQSNLSMLIDKTNAQLKITNGNLQSQVTATAEKFSLAFNNLGALGDALNEYTDKLNMYFDFAADGLTIGQTNSQFKMKLTNEKMSFYEGTAEIAYMSGQKLYINNAQILESIRIGAFAYIPEKDGSLSFKKIGG